MAGDWLKIREDLHEDPAVLRMAAALETRPEHVVGYCLRFWGWVSRNVSLENRDACPSASVVGVPILSIESVLHLPGFLPLLREVGWLEYDETAKPIVVTIPKFERHLSETAKQRALAAEKKRRQRAEKDGKFVPKNQDKCPPKTGTREEKRREDLIKGNTPLNNPLARFVKPTLAEVAAYCAERRNAIEAQAFIDHYESNGWRVGKVPMKDWQAAVRNWEKNSRQGTFNGKSRTSRVGPGQLFDPNDTAERKF
jgi:hypothetical protein